MFISKQMSRQKGSNNDRSTAHVQYVAVAVAAFNSVHFNSS